MISSLNIILPWNFCPLIECLWIFSMPVSVHQTFDLLLWVSDINCMVKRNACILAVSFMNFCYSSGLKKEKTNKFCVRTIIIVVAVDVM